ncbi:acyl-CoA dehydrogenase family protein [Mycobacterium sp. M26]|uniref:acyl-CoA dehydrogenase family protein n=1 Tax=Mycobacterium sp. M26 TaxID=1762962 RepID=UPI00073ECC68|nr:acyl-CoA dehydrogenase family protein [Mycobacterium sp. M26]
MRRTTSQSVLDAVRALLPDIAAAAADVDRTAAVSPRVIADLHAAGYFSLLQPARFGGLDADPADYLTATRELSAACTSTGWLAGWLGVNTWGLALRDMRAQEEIWGADPQALMCSSYAPTGRMERVDGGFWLTGRWNRCIGASQASWLNAAVLRVGPDGAAQDFMAVLVPNTDYEVEPRWNGLGLKGISAEDIVVTGAFVPDHRAFSWLNSRIPDRLAPVFLLPQPTLYTLAGTIPLLGAAQRLLGERRADRAEPLSPLAMAAADVELSVRQVQRNVADLISCVAAGGFPESALVLRTRRDQVMASERSFRAVQEIVRDHGSGIDEALLERIWRDVQTARMHVSSNVEQVLALVGRFSMGLPVDDLIW